MCGIFGYVGDNLAGQTILDGLRHLVYRGYDSVGIATIAPDRMVDIRKYAGDISALAQGIDSSPMIGGSGLGHTRWATHGNASVINAHPHMDSESSIVVVHNGMVENYVVLRNSLESEGYVFVTDTDTEVIPHLLRKFLDNGCSLPEAVRKSGSMIEGPHSIAVMDRNDPTTIIAMRNGYAGGLVVGHGANEIFLSSDMHAFPSEVHSVGFLAPGDLAILKRDGWEVQGSDGTKVDRLLEQFEHIPGLHDKGGHSHFMLKEILDQPESVLDCLRAQISASDRKWKNESPFAQNFLDTVNRVILLGVGTSLYAAQIGARFIERDCNIPATAENAAEFRYRDPVLDSRTLVIPVGQSGETADTLGATILAKRLGAKIVAVCNVPGSQLTRIADKTILMEAGLEVSVPSTKTFTNAVISLRLLALRLAQERKTIRAKRFSKSVDELFKLPGLINQCLELNRRMPGIVTDYLRYGSFLFIGRGMMESIAREASLKLKEVAYVHGEGMSAAELKHGPIALVDEDTPVVALVLKDHLYEKMVGNVSQVKSRGGKVLAVLTDGDKSMAAKVDEVLWVPNCDADVHPVIAAIPLQLFAFHYGLAAGYNVDQPRNLAKTVTVE